LAAVSGFSQTTVKTSVSGGAKSAENYGKLPLAFEANHGQADPSVKFLSRGSGYSLFLTDSEAVLALGTADCKANADGHGSLPGRCVTTQDSVRMRLDGAQDSNIAKATGEAELLGKVNYFIGNDPAQWRTGLPTYARVRLSRVYSGIDLVYYGRQGQLEYDFVVAPGANAAAIRLSFAGEKNLRIAANGDLVLQGEHGSATFHRPVVYQEKDGRRQPVAGSFQLAANNSVGFSLGNYDHKRALIIDPILVYSTYLGGSGNVSTFGDQGNAIAVDAAGEAYVVGTAHSVDFPVTAGAYQSTNKPANSQRYTVFATKMNAAGTALLFSTYLGGSYADLGFGIALDSSGNAYITGTTYSSDFPVTCGAFQTVFPGTTSNAPTAFVAKLNQSGTGLVYSTFLGGSGNKSTSFIRGDTAQAIAVKGGNAYVTGYTSSADFPVTAGVFQDTFNGTVNYSNAFVTELNGNGTHLVYSTYLGGQGSNGPGDVGNAIALDAGGDAFVAGITTSPDFPVTSGSAEPVASFGGLSIGFVTKLNSTGTAQVYSTFLGGSQGGSVQAIVVDGSGNAYVAGNTNSPDFPTTSPVLEPATSWAGGDTGFVTKINQDGSAWIYSTYLEGLGTSVFGLAVDSSGAAYVTGSAPATNTGTFGNFMTTPDALATPSSTTKSAFVVKLDPSATVLNYATLFGGSSTDGGIALALDASGNAYVTGFAESTDFPVTSGAYQATNKAASAGRNAFIGKFALADENNQTVYPSPSVASPPYDTETDFSLSDYGITNAYQCGEYLSYDATVILQVYPLTGPGTLPLTGTVALTLPGASGSVDVSDQTQYLDIQGTANPPGIYTISASYSGDANYNPSSNSFDFDFSCPDTSGASLASGVPGTPVGGRHLKLPLTPRTKPANSAAEKPPAAGLSLARPKFRLPSAIPYQSSQRSMTKSSVQSQVTPLCRVSLPALTVAVSSPVGRLYGAANPKLSYGIVGLRNGDTVTVTLQTTATPTSPVGAYPITVTVTGAALAHYTLNVIPGTLYVRPATLYIVPSSVAVVYGHTPPSLTAYKLIGFVNGDTASVVSGAPVFSTTVTSITPAGIYKIGVQTGTLTAANYVFSGVSNGGGVVDVTRAPLALTASNLTMTQGSPVPTLTYTLTGFVNGQSAAGTVTGTPALTTTATAASRPGKYPITITQGSLSAANYFFVKVNGVLTVTP
jgi:hypothetical protein